MTNTIDTIRAFAIANINETPEDFPNYELLSLSLNREADHRNMEEYVGEIAFEDTDGQEVTSVFVVYEYDRDGRLEFEWC